MISNLVSARMMTLIGWGVFHFAWQGACIALLTHILLRLFVRCSAALRYRLCLGSLLLTVLLPILTVSTGEFASVRFSLERSDDQTVPVQIKDVLDYDGVWLVARQYRQEAMTLSAWERSLNYLESRLPVIAACWILGVFLVSLFRLTGFLRFRLKLNNHPALIDPLWEEKISHMIQRLKIKQSVRILVSSSLDVPAIAGWLKPVLLVPVSFLSGLDSQSIESIFFHELAHIKRCDYLVNLIQMLIETLGFFHPAVWWLSDRIRCEREHCCDDLAVRETGDPFTYARALINLEEKRPLTTVVLAANGSHLRQRIAHLISNKTENGASAPFTLLFFLLGMLSLILFPGFTRLNLPNAGKPVIPDKLKSHQVIYYPLDGSAEDFSGTLQHGIVEGATPASDRFGNCSGAYAFDGIDDRIGLECSGKLNTLRSFSVSCWIYIEKNPNYAAWVSQSYTGAARSQWRAGFGIFEQCEWGLTETSVSDKRKIWMDYYITACRLPRQRWIHLTMVVDRDRQTVQLYQNGNLTGKLRDVSPFIEAPTQFWIGYQADNPVFFRGKMDDVRVFDCPLTNDEAALIYRL